MVKRVIPPKRVPLEQQLDLESMPKVKNIHTSMLPGKIAFDSKEAIDAVLKRPTATPLNLEPNAVAALTCSDRQMEAWALLNDPVLRYTLLYGGARSGKTQLIVRAIINRAMMWPGSRHLITRLHQNAVWPSIGLDTLPKVMRLYYPEIKYTPHRMDGYILIDGAGSEIWLGGLDDKERVEKILGREYVSVYLCECSQIPYASALLALTRLAQVVDSKEHGHCPQKAFYDLNPVGKGHWTNKLFHQHKNPTDDKVLIDANLYGSMQLNPADNRQNLDTSYLRQLASMPVNYRKRFEKGEYVEELDNALWSLETFELLRVADDELPDMQRIVVAVDPSGAESEDDLTHDEIGIVVTGLGVDGHGYCLADLTMLGAPVQWARVAINAFNHFDADSIVGETNYGGAMVKATIHSVDPTVPFREVKASRGKVVRAEPVSSLGSSDQQSGQRIHHVGRRNHDGSITNPFLKLEDELTNFTDMGYVGLRSPNRADAYVWGFTELMVEKNSVSVFANYYKNLAAKASGRAQREPERVRVVPGTTRGYGAEKPVKLYTVKTIKPNEHICLSDGARYSSGPDRFIRNIPEHHHKPLLDAGCIAVEL